MKQSLIYILLGLSLSTMPAFSEGDPVPASTPEQEIEKAFQREYSYLAAQREALTRQRQKIEGKTTADLANARKSVQELSVKLASMQAGNDSLFSDVQDAEKIKREERNLGEQLQVIWRKARRTLEETRHSLRFESGKPEIGELIPPEQLQLSELARIGDEALTLAEGSSKLVRFRGSYLDKEGRLSESTLFRLGRVAVFADSPRGVMLLGPDGKGSLRVIEEDQKGAARSLLDNKQVSSVPVYLFESLQDRLTIKKPAGVTDRIADLIPLLFLGILFLMVGFLFAQLARA